MKNEKIKIVSLFLVLICFISIPAFMMSAERNHLTGELHLESFSGENMTPIQADKESNTLKKLMAIEDDDIITTINSETNEEEDTKILQIADDQIKKMIELDFIPSFNTEQEKINYRIAKESYIARDHSTIFLFYIIEINYQSAKVYMLLDAELQKIYHFAYMPALELESKNKLESGFNAVKFLKYLGIYNKDLLYKLDEEGRYGNFFFDEEIFNLRVVFYNNRNYIEFGV